MPFHYARKVVHHALYALRSAFNRIGVWLLGEQCGVCSNSIMRLRKALPGRTTLHAWLRCPIKDSRSLRVHMRLPSQDWSREVRRLILPSGRRSLPAVVSISIPKNVRHVVGPTVLCSAMGTAR